MNKSQYAPGGKKQSVVSSILWLTIAEVLFNFSGYVIHAFLGRMLGPADYGRYALVVTLTTVVIMLIGNGIPTAMSKYVSASFETTPELVLIIKRQALILQSIIIGIITIIFYLLAPVTAKLLNDPSLTPLLRISAFIIPSFAAASFYLFYYIGLHRFSLQATLKIVRSMARIGFVISLAYFFGLKGSVAAYIFAPASVFVTAWIIDALWVDRDFPRSKAAPPAGGFAWQKLLDYAWPVTLFMLFYEVLISLDLYAVKALLRDDALTGVYNAALTVGRIPYYLFYALTMVMLPSISRTTAQEDHTETRRIIRQTVRMMTMVLIPMLVLMVAYAEPLITLFFGQRYLGGAQAMQVLVPGVIFLTVFYVMSSALNGAGKVRIPMTIAFAGMILNALLNYLLVLRMGIIGSALATTLTSILITFVILYFVRRQFGSLIRWQSLAKFMLAGGVVALAASFFPPTKWIFILSSLILSGLYLGILVAIGEFTKSDVDLFRRMLFSRKKKVAPPAMEDAGA